jgi:hypothetical protein
LTFGKRNTQMKTIIAIVTLALTGALMAQEGRKRTEPADLASLRKDWQVARDRATDSIDTKYVRALEAMKQRYTKAGELQSALAVEAELQLLKFDADALPTTKSELGEFLINTDWKLRNSDGKPSGGLRFRDNGVIEMPWHACTWHPEESRVAIMNNGNAWRFRIEFSENMMKVVVKHTDGRVEWEGEFSEKVKPKKTE